MMRLRFYNRWYAGVDQGSTLACVELQGQNNVPEAVTTGFNKYLLSAMSTDFPEHHPSFADKVLDAIEKILKNEIRDYTWEGDGFVHMISREKVIFEHNIFGECPEWPIWTCTLEQYKAALKGWRQFIDMPKSIDTELIVDLPEGTA